MAEYNGKSPVRMWHHTRTGDTEDYNMNFHCAKFLSRRNKRFYYNHLILLFKNLAISIIFYNDENDATQY